MKRIIGGKEVLAKNLPTGVRGLRMAAPKYSTAQVEAGASAALAAGAIGGELAQQIASALTMGGVGAVPAHVIAFLEDQGE
jgi:hypothetical protein